MLARNGNFDLIFSSVHQALPYYHQSYIPLRLLPFFYINHNVEEVRLFGFSYVIMFNGIR